MIVHLLGAHGGRTPHVHGVEFGQNSEQRLRARITVGLADARPFRLVIREHSLGLGDEAFDGRIVDSAEGVGRIGDASGAQDVSACLAESQEPSELGMITRHGASWHAPARRADAQSYGRDIAVHAERAREVEGSWDCASPGGAPPQLIRAILGANLGALTR